MKEKEYDLKKIAIIVVIICVLIVIIEAGLFLYLRHKNEQNSTYYDAYQMVRVDSDNNLIAVGSSDFKKSKHNEYTDGLEKGKLVKYDKDGNVIFEVQYDKGFSSTFTSVLIEEDGYIVTGSGEYDEYQQENNLRDAFLIKYDLKGNKVWEKYYGVLANTRFNKVVKTSDGYVVIGQSLYENMEVGNHTTGGGVIVKYDFDGNEIWHNNHGGNKSGNFNGIIEVDGNFYVAGKDGMDSGNIVKFNSNGKYLWHKNYSYTDNEGLQDIVYNDNKLYVVGSKKILEDEEAEQRTTDNTEGVIIVYDMKGKVEEEITFGGSKLERFTSIQFIDDKFYIGGISNSLDSSLDIKLDEEKEGISSAFVVTYNKDLEVEDSKVLGGTNNDVLSDMTLNDNNLYISLYSNSKDGTLSKEENNGKDYFGKIVIMDTDLEFDVIK